MVHIGREQRKCQCCSGFHLLVVYDFSPTTLKKQVYNDVHAATNPNKSTILHSLCMALKTTLIKRVGAIFTQY